MDSLIRLFVDATSKFIQNDNDSRYAKRYSVKMLTITTRKLVRVWCGFFISHGLVDSRQQDDACAENLLVRGSRHKNTASRPMADA